MAVWYASLVADYFESRNLPASLAEYYDSDLGISQSILDKFSGAQEVVFYSFIAFVVAIFLLLLVFSVAVFLCRDWGRRPFLAMQFALIPAYLLFSPSIATPLFASLDYISSLFTGASIALLFIPVVKIMFQNHDATTV